MKILVISDYRDTTASRPEAEIFVGLKELGMEVDIMTYGDCAYAEVFRSKGIRVIDFHPEKKFDKKAVKLIRDELVRGKHQVMHLFNSKATINGLRAAKGLRVKVVLYRGYTGNIHWYDPTIYLKYFHPRVDMILCLAEAIEELIKKNSLFAGNKTITIHKGHSLDWYKDIQPVTSFAAFEIPDNAFVAVCAANVRRMKGIPWLVKASYHLPTDLPIHFLLLGRGYEEPAIKRLIEKSPNRDKIHTPGHQKDSLRIVAAASVFVLASIKGEAITKAVIEAMSLGVAPVITDIPGNKMLVLHNQCGLVVPPRNSEAIAGAILQLYNNPDLRKKFGAKAKEHIRINLNIRDTIQKVKKLYEVLAGSP